MNESFKKIVGFFNLKTSESDNSKKARGVVKYKKKKASRTRLSSQQDYYNSYWDSSKLNACFIMLVIYIVIGFALYHFLK